MGGLDCFFLTHSLDPIIRKDWEKYIGDQADLPSFKTISEFIGGGIWALQSSELQPHKRASTSFKPPKLARSLATVARDLCPERNEHHRLNDCHRFLQCTPRERVTMVRKVKGCFKCLRLGHWAENCRSGKSCSTCSSAHHEALHDGLARKRSSGPRNEDGSRKRQRLSESSNSMVRDGQSTTQA